MTDAVRRCPVCGKPIGYSSQLCDQCSAQPKSAAVETQEWIEEGQLALERYLACWAAFDEWLSVRPHG